MAWSFGWAAAPSHPIPTISSTRVTIHPAAAAVRAGETIAVEVWVEEVSGLYGADIQLLFNPAAFQVMDANPSLAGDQIVLRDDLLQPGFVIHHEADNRSGTIWYANAQTNPAAPASGSGALFEFHLLALENGVFPVAVSSQQLSDKDGNPLAAVSQDALFSIQGYQVYLPFSQR